MEFGTDLCRILAKEFEETGDPKVIWEAHSRALKLAIAIWKKLANLGNIGRSSGFTFVVSRENQRGQRRLGASCGYRGRRLIGPDIEAVEPIPNITSSIQRGWCLSNPTLTPFNI